MQPLSELDPAVLKHARGENLSPEETEIVKKWRSQSPERDQLLKDIETGAPRIIREMRDTIFLDTTDIWNRVVAELTAEGAGPFPAAAPVVSMRQTSKRFWKIAGIVACVPLLILLGIAVFRWMNGPAIKPVTTLHNNHNIHRVADIRPGANKAVLTLADGNRIALDPVSTGRLSSQENTTISIVNAGQVRYSISAAYRKLSAPLYNVLATPRAGQFSLILPDGSHVWLNNASWLRYPVQFTDSTREVELKGEACFEITPDTKHPFKVHIIKGASPIRDDRTLIVLGTSFNVKAYDDEDTIYTTLANGKLVFQRNGRGLTLSPGDQSVLSGDSVEIRHNVDATIAMAWKGGNFNFHHDDLESTMRQLARWYDVKVEYQDKPTGAYAFEGGISRSLTLQEILDNLEKYGVHSQLKGRTIIVRP